MASLGRKVRKPIVWSKIAFTLISGEIETSNIKNFNEDETGKIFNEDETGKNSKYWHTKQVHTILL